MVESPRKKAVKILIEIEKNSAYSNIEMNKLRSSNLYSDLDARFIGELVNGVIKRKITLDKIIAIHSKVKINKIAPFVLNVLRIGIYQIIYMNKVPDSAAVNECIKIIKKSSVSRLSSYVNAVLRAVSSFMRGRGPGPSSKRLEGGLQTGSCQHQPHHGRMSF